MNGDYTATEHAPCIEIGVYRAKPDGCNSNEWLIEQPLVVDDYWRGSKVQYDCGIVEDFVTPVHRREYIQNSRLVPLSYIGIICK